MKTTALVLFDLYGIWVIFVRPWQWRRAQKRQG